MDVGEFDQCGLYTGLRLDYRLRLWLPTSASCTISALAELLVRLSVFCVCLVFLYNCCLSFYVVT